MESEGRKEKEKEGTLFNWFYILARSNHHLTLWLKLKNLGTVKEESPNSGTGVDGNLRAFFIEAFLLSRLQVEAQQG